MTNEDRSSDVRPKILFVGGSINQTSQMLQISRAFRPGCAAHYFSPCYLDGWLQVCQRYGLADMSVAGFPTTKRCLEYLERQGVAIDYGGRQHRYDLVFCAQDLVVPENITHSKLVLVQEGMTDPEGIGFALVMRFRWLPRWIASTAATGLSDRYDRFCVASEGYRQLFIRRGARPEKLVVTGIPNFDDCERYRRNSFPHRGYVLVCTSDARETFKRDNRRAFLRRAVHLAGGRPLVFKLHPNENWERSMKEIRSVAPQALVFTEGSAEEMVANCAVLVVQYSTLAFVGLALGKEVHSYFDSETLHRLLPLQNRNAAARIARVGCDLLGLPFSLSEREPELASSVRVA
jgi:hypothetical protein